MSGERTLRHRSSAPLTRNRRRVAAFSVPWRPYLLPLVFFQLLFEIGLLLSRNLVVELGCWPGVGIVVAIELLAFGSEVVVCGCEASKL